MIGRVGCFRERLRGVNASTPSAFDPGKASASRDCSEDRVLLVLSRRSARYVTAHRRETAA